MARTPHDQPRGIAGVLSRGGRVILCGIDDSSVSHTAAHVALQLAERLEATLLLVHVGPAPSVAAWPMSTFVERKQRQEAYDEAGLLRTVLEPVPVRGANVERRVVFGDQPCDALRSLAEDAVVKLIVVGSCRQGRLDAALLGSTSGELARSAPCPVVVVPHGVSADSCPAGGTVVCGVSGDSEAAVVAETAADLAQRLGLSLVLAHFDESRSAAAPDVPLEAARSAAPALAIEVQVAAGAPAEGLAALAREQDAPLIAVGTRGRGSLKAAVLGSVSADVVRIADRPVLVVPPPE